MKELKNLEAIAMVLTLMEMLANRVSTRKVSQITEELCGTKFSKNTGSELRKNLDPNIEGSTQQATFRCPVFFTGRCHVPKS